MTLGVLALAAAGCGTDSMSILAVYLRQRGSPESKPVGAPPESTGKGG
jgi:hypothetical protein